MFEIDKEKFGAFVAQLRKEKGLMQKQIAEALHISDKAVSKWERGLSMPDITLLVPLAEILGVTVTELLECRRIPQAESMDPKQTEDLVKKVIGLSAEEPRYSPERWKRGAALAACTMVSGLELVVLYHLGYSASELLLYLSTTLSLMLIFGIYFCMFAKERLPAYYDEYPVDVYSDGFFRMNLPGLHLNNHSWPKILLAARLWSMIGLVATPLLYLLITKLFPGVWSSFGVWITLLLTLGGLFIPMYIIGRKYRDPRTTTGSKRRSWIALVILLGVLLLAHIFGLMSFQSGLQVGWSERGGASSWSARYALHTGFVQKTINAASEDLTLHISVTTESGIIGVSVTELEDDQVIFSEETDSTALYDIPIHGPVTVRISGQEHRGSFSLRWD